jgi:hypothetical protein
VHAKKGRDVYPELIINNLAEEVVPVQIIARNLPPDDNVEMGLRTPKRTERNLFQNQESSGSGRKTRPR